MTAGNRASPRAVADYGLGMKSIFISTQQGDPYPSRAPQRGIRTELPAVPRDRAATLSARELKISTQRLFLETEREGLPSQRILIAPVAKCVRRCPVTRRHPA
jgi:hypothetical protein